MKEYKLILPDGYVKQPLPGRDAWLKALRSGEYEQGREALCQDGAYCCLGVKCVLEDLPKTSFGDNMTKFWGELFQLPHKSPSFAALSDYGDFTLGITVEVNGDRKGSLAACNDSGLTFLQIADIIEAVWEESK